MMAGLVALRFSEYPDQYYEEILYFCDFSGGVRTPCPHPLDLHMIIKKLKVPYIWQLTLFNRISAHALISAMLSSL